VNAQATTARELEKTAMNKKLGEPRALVRRASTPPRTGGPIARAAVVLFAAAALALGVTSARAGADATSTAVQVTGVGGAGQPATAVDGLTGSKIAFSRLCAVSLPPAGCPLSVEHQGAEIWTMNGDGSEPTQLTHNTTWDLAPVWSPDDRTVAFFGVQYDPTTDKPVGPPHIYLVDANSGEQTPLTYQVGGDAIPVVGRFPSFSPDGRKIAFDNGGPQSGDILVVNADGSETPANLTQNAAARNIRPDWSPDGRKIAFVSRRDGNDEIYVMNADGTAVTQLTSTSKDAADNEPAADNAPAWSPNGQRIVFQRTLGDGNEEIYVMNADGSDQTRLTNWPGTDEDPDWSPDGRWIAFHRAIEPIGAEILEVFVMKADGSDPMPLTAEPSENAHPGWGHGPALRH
jgi:Tol biopolymer transport system component